MTWAQLGQHNKPIVLANINGFWSPFLALLAHMREETFIRDGLDVNFVVVDQAREIIPAISEALVTRTDERTTGNIVETF